jgi:hypothetical protein
VRAGLLDISAIRPRTFPLSALPEAMEAAATAGSLKCVVAAVGSGTRWMMTKVKHFRESVMYTIRPKYPRIMGDHYVKL